MYQYIIGTITEIHEDFFVLENFGIGYKIICSKNTMESLSVKEEYKIFLEHIIREDMEVLYGFSSHQEKEMFKLLTTVTSIGPKNAIQILSSLTIQEVKSAIVHEDVNLLTSAQGVGKKTASRIILELQDKVEYVEPMVENHTTVDHSSEINFAKDALITLGYAKQEVDQFFENFSGEGFALEDLIKEAMKKLDK